MRTRPARDSDLKVPLLADAGQEVRHALMRTASVRTWDSGSSVFFEDDPGDFLLVLLKGRAKVVLEAQEDKQELILAFIEPFAVVGELAPLDAAARSASVITLEKSEFLRIPGPALLQAIQAVPAIGIAMIKHLSRIIRSVDERLRTISMFDAHGQTVRALYLFCEKREERPAELVLSGFPQILQIAQMLGCRRETISNALGELEKGGYVRTVRGARAGGSLRQVTLTRKAVNTYLKGLRSPIH